MIYNCGIYFIVNKINNHFYIGGSIDLVDRKRDHWYELKTNSHSNRHLQNSWNKYGELIFEFIHILYCNESHLDFYEQKFLDKFVGSVGCYNISKYVDAGMRGRRHSEKTKRKMSVNHYDCSGHRNPFYGKKHSDETKLKISNSCKGIIRGPHSSETKKKIGDGNRGKMVNSVSKIKCALNNPSRKLAENDIRIIKSELNNGVSSRDLAAKYGVIPRSIRNIKNNKTWKWL